MIHTHLRVLAVVTARGDAFTLHVGEFGEVELAGYTLHPLVLVFALSGSLMISRIRIPKL